MPRALILLGLVACGARTGLPVEGRLTDAGPIEDAAPEASVPETSVPDAALPDVGAPGAAKVVLFGGQSPTGNAGALRDTWVFDGASWTVVTPPVSPPARIQATMAPLGASSQVVLFGGAGTGSAALADTWTFDGAAWSEVSAPAPPGRNLASMAALDGTVVLFGGWGQNGQALGDTWTFDGASWTAVPSPGPSARAYATMASLGSRVILFGGAGNGGQALDDTWSFDGHAWSRVAVATVPHATYGALGASLGGLALAFGGDWGTVSSGIGSNVIWAFDGQSWSMQSPSPHPDYTWAALATRGDSVVLFGGSGNAGSNQTWTFQGSAWSTVTVATPPPPRAWAAMASLP